MNLEGKVVLVTGAGRGLGRELARAFGAAGARVAVNDINPDNALKTAQLIEETGGTARDFVADVSKKFPVQALLNEIEDLWGVLDILVNNARVFPKKSLIDMDEWDWRRTLDVNLTANFVMTQVAGRMMRAAEKKGLILTMVTRPDEESGRGAFLATQEALLGLARSASAELSAYGIRVGTVLVSEEVRDAKQAELAERVADLCADGDWDEHANLVELKA